ncbi:MAG: RagB/SusD protein [Gemmatimonadetes bacterium]|nr:RagB/SusD protein [Gemmatimonadota bacterium]
MPTTTQFDRPASRVHPRRYTLAIVAVSMLIATACNLDVENPGPVQDQFLDLASAHQAVVNGAGRAIANSLASGTGGALGFDASAVARELHPGGQTGSFGISPQLSVGIITADETDNRTSKASAARWVAEAAVDRIRAALPAADFAKSPIAAQGLLYVGFSNRLLGENMCETTIDGGPRQPASVHFTRAEAAFTEAIAIAKAVNNAAFTNAAYGGRASVRTWLGNWAGAAADAALTPKAYKFQALYNNLDREQLNSYFFAMDGSTFRNETVWHTWYADYYDLTKDPRVKYLTFPQWKFTQGSVGDLGDGRGVVGQVLFYQQQKYTAQGSPIDLTDGREAQMIVAESKLRTGDIAGAMALVNDLRTDAGVPLRNTAITSDSAWTYLKLETLIETYLEGRALGLRRRWDGAGKDPATPGGLPALLRMDDRKGKDTCFPIGRTELNTNPNLAIKS